MREIRSSLICCIYAGETFELPIKLYSLSASRPQTYEHASTTLYALFFSFYCVNKSLT